MFERIQCHWAMRVFFFVYIGLSMINKSSAQGNYCLRNPFQRCCKYAKALGVDLQNDFSVSIDNLSCSGSNRTAKISVKILSSSEFFSSKILVQIFATDGYNPIYTEYFDNTSYTGEYQLTSNKSNFYLRVCLKRCSCLLYKEHFNFTFCKVPENVPVTPRPFLTTTSYQTTLSTARNFDKNYWYAVLIPCIFVIAGLTVFFFILLYKKIRFSSQQHDYQVSGTSTLKSNTENTTEINTLSQELQKMQIKVTQQIKLFIAFTNDHAMHQDVIINFVKFLQADLGFQVYCELFSDHDISLDPVGWVEKCLCAADKVLVLWSPGGVQKWNNENVDDNITNDLFTPVLRRVRNDIFHNVNVGKYCFGYFDYYNKETIPEVFAEPRVYHFKLMKQFDDLYFRLKGIERYLPGCALKIDEVMQDGYYNHDITQYGSALRDSINAMSEYVINHPQWHIEKVPNASQLPRIDDLSEKYLIKQLHMSIMPPIPIQNVSEISVGNEGHYFNEQDQRTTASKNNYQTQVREDACLEQHNWKEQGQNELPDTREHTKESPFIAIDDQYKNKANDINGNFIPSEMFDSGMFTNDDAMDSKSIQFEEQFENVHRAPTKTDSFFKKNPSTSKLSDSLLLDAGVSNINKNSTQESQQTEYRMPNLQPQFDSIQRLQTTELSLGKTIFSNSCEIEPSARAELLCRSKKKIVVLAPVDQNEEPMVSLMYLNNLSMAQ